MGEELSRGGGGDGEGTTYYETENREICHATGGGDWIPQDTYLHRAD